MITNIINFTLLLPPSSRLYTDGEEFCNGKKLVFNLINSSLKPGKAEISKRVLILNIADFLRLHGPQGPLQVYDHRSLPISVATIRI